MMDINIASMRPWYRPDNGKLTGIEFGVYGKKGNIAYRFIVFFDGHSPYCDGGRKAYYCRACNHNSPFWTRVLHGAALAAISHGVK